MRFCSRLLQPAERIGGYGFGQGVHLQAGGAVQRRGGGAVLGGGYDQQAPFRAEGVEHTFGSVVGAEAIVGDEDDAAAFVAGPVLDLLFGRGDERGDEDAAVLHRVHPDTLAAVQFFGGIFAADFHGFDVGVFKQVDVAVGFVSGAVRAGDNGAAEKVRVIHALQSAARVVADVAEHALQLVFLQQDAVVIAFLED